MLEEYTAIVWRPSVAYALREIATPQAVELLIEYLHLPGVPTALAQINSEQAWSALSHRGMELACDLGADPFAVAEVQDVLAQAYRSRDFCSVCGLGKHWPEVASLLRDGEIHWWNVPVPAAPPWLEPRWGHAARFRSYLARPTPRFVVAATVILPPYNGLSPIYHERPAAAYGPAVEDPALATHDH
jgi:hypothetical protein